jgi:hypothetical protein
MEPITTPTPKLRIRYTTKFGIIEDPLLRATVHECRTIIAVRQRDFSTSLIVTITDSTTGEILFQTEYPRGHPLPS